MIEEALDDYFAPNKQEMIAEFYKQMGKSGLSSEEI